MGLKRTGALLFGIGLLLASLAAAVPEHPEQTCPDAPFTVGLAGVDAAAGAFAIAVRCTVYEFAWPVTLGLVLLVVGAALGTAGVGGELVDEW